jgi:heat shock protein beta
VHSYSYYLILGLLFAGATETTESSIVTPPESAEKYVFEAEVHKMLDIVVNSLYQNKDVFLRELISNASDALDKFRIMAMTKPEDYKSDRDSEIPLEVKIEYNVQEKTLTIRDTGIGMTHDDMVKNLGTVARSGTTKFIETLKESGSGEAGMGQIGQFGVGFYSTFLVADRVVVASKSPTDSTQHVWESENGSGDFLVYPDPRGNTLARGTEITLHLKEDCVEFSEPRRLMELAKHYSEFVMHPISLRITEKMMVEIDEEEEDESAEEEKKDEDDLEVTEDEETEKPKKTEEVTTYSWEVLNGNQAIWTRDKDEITDDEYQSFYEGMSGETANASSWVHFNAEGSINFKSILYLPEDIPSSYKFGNLDDVPGAMRLYVRKVLIGSAFELMPKYLGFIRGVVDSDDLPLNVNRESLQESKILQVIRKKLVRKAIDLIRTYAKESDSWEAEAEIDADGTVKLHGDKKKKIESPYDKWYRKFSSNIKLGVMDDEPNRAKLSKLLRFETSKSNGKLVSLESYVENMKDWQTEIYVLGGTNSEALMKSAFLEVFIDKDVEVLFLTDAVDEYLVKQVRDFDTKKFVQISSENVKFKDEDEDMVKRRQKAYKAPYEQLTKWLRKLYHDGLTGILRVQVAKRNLGSTPAVVSTSDFGNSANMERILRAQAFQQGVDMDTMVAMKILEINPRHPIILKLLEAAPAEGEEDTTEVPEDIVDAAYMLYDMAMLNGGFPISDPAAHNMRSAKVMQKMFDLDSLALEPEIDPPVEEDEAPEFDLMSKAGGMNMDDLKDLNLDDMDLDL